MTLLMGFFGHTVLNLFGATALANVIVIISIFIMEKHKKDVNILHLFGLLSFVGAFISLAFVYYPYDIHSTAASLAISFYVLFVIFFTLPSIVWILKDLPASIKNRRESRKKAKKVVQEVVKKLNNIVEL